MPSSSPTSSVHNVTADSDLRQQLFARFHEALVRFFTRRIRVQAHAEDLAQDTLLRVLRARAFTQVEDAEKYVFRVAINQLRNHQARARHFDDPNARIDLQQAIESESEAQLMEACSPERVLIGRDSLHDVLRILGELEERTRNIFVLFRLENMRQKEIAALYGIGQSTVEKHVMKATAHLLARSGAEKRS